jgi:hypothetical protein
MAKLNAPFSFTGPLGNISVYMMRGVDKPVVRQKGGPSKETVKNSPRLANTRKINDEFGGRATAAKWVTRHIFPLKQLADYNIVGPLNALLKPIQLLDTVHALGQRDVVLSKSPQLLSGFSLNRNNGFDSTVRNPLSFSLDRATLSAQVDIPALLPGINFWAPVRFPMYSIVVSVGVIPDLFYGANGYTPSSPDYKETGVGTIYTDWYPVMKGSPALTLQVKYGREVPDDNYSVVLSIGIRYGVMQDATTIQQAKHAGAAKILGMA